MSTTPPPLPSEGATYPEVLARLGDVSKRISEMLRALGIGTVVFCWGFFVADKGVAQDVAYRHRFWIVITAMVAVLGLLLDLLQAIVAYQVANRLRREMEAEDATMKTFPYNSLLYRSQTFFFYSKSILMPLAAASVIVLLLVMVLQAPSKPPAPPHQPCCCACPDPDPPVRGN
jgi:hypothetical protein